MTRLAQLIARMEGFGQPGAIPTTHNNPGDLKHSPHSTHPGDPNSIGMIDTPEHGWEDLERQLRLYAERNLTLQDLFGGHPPDVAAIYAPSGDRNNPAEYLEFVCDGLALPPETPVSVALEIMA